MKFLTLVAAFAFFSPIYIFCADTEFYPIDADLRVVESGYTKIIVDWIRARNDIPSVSDASRLVHLRAITTEGHATYVGLEQVMEIQAPLSRVEGVLDDMDHYEELFPDLKDVKVVTRDKNQSISTWEQVVPILPNIHYEMLYLKGRDTRQRLIYRYALKDGRTIKNSDGMIVLESLGPQKTRYYEVDFFNADWGPVAFMGKDHIWKDCITGIYVSDLSIKFLAENPSLARSQALVRAKEFAAKHPLDEIVKMRSSHPFFAVKK